MKLNVNGEQVEITSELSISELLTEQKVKMPDMVTVELNGQILKRTEFEDIRLNEGDNVEFLYFMGGGNVIE